MNVNPSSTPSSDAKNSLSEAYSNTLSRGVLNTLDFLTPKSGFEGLLAVFLGAAVALLISIQLWNGLHAGLQTYPDLVAGYIIWTDRFKDGDFRSLFVFLFLTGLFSAITVAISKAIVSPLVCSVASSSKRIIEASRALGLHIASGMLAAVGALWLIKGYRPEAELSIIVATSIATLVFFTTNRFRSKAQSITPFVSTSILFSLFTSIGFLGILACRFCFDTTPLRGDIDDRLESTAIIALVFSVSALAGFPAKARMILQVLNAALQLFSPLLLLVYWRAVYSNSTLSVSPNWVGKSFLILVISAMLIEVTVGLVKAYRMRRHELGWNAQIRASTAVALTAFLFFTPGAYSVSLVDDFHLGETLIPWQQITDFGQRLYTDFVSVQGVLGLSFGASNWLFFDNTLATYPIAAFWVLVLANCITSLLICSRIGSGWGLLLAPITATALDRVLLIPAIFLILSSNWVTQNLVRWCLVFGIIASLHFLWIPSTGTALILALAPFFIACACELVKKRELGRTLQDGRVKAVCIGLLLVIFTAITSPYILRALSFVSENGSTNTVAYGVMIGIDDIPPQFPHWFASPLLNAIVWESIRFGWIIGSFLLVLFSLLAIKNEGKKLRSILGLLLLTIGGALFSYALIPYSAGRIDAHSLSRSGSVSMLMFGFFIPISAIIFHQRYKIWPIPFAFVGLCLGIRLSYVAPAFTNLVERTTPILPVSSDSILVDGRLAGFPNLGNGLVPMNKWDEIIRFRGALNRYLKPGETYFDLTNRSAFYYYLGLRVPSPYSADYLAANEKIQSRIVTRLEREHPPVVWIGPSIRFDESPAGIRSYRILRWFIENKYRYESVDGNQFLVRPDRVLQSESPERIEEIYNVLGRSDLARLPIAWGRNFSKLQTRFKSVATLSPGELESGLVKEADDWVQLRSGFPRFTFLLPKLEEIERPDYLLLTIGRRGSKKVSLKAELLWDTDKQTFVRGSGLTFSVQPGTLLIPLGGHLGWLRSNGQKHLRLEIVGEKVTSRLRIERAELLRLVK